jgi:hypothetical protein
MIPMTTLYVINNLLRNSVIRNVHEKIVAYYSRDIFREREEKEGEYIVDNR